MKFTPAANADDDDNAYNIIYNKLKTFVVYDSNNKIIIYHRFFFNIKFYYLMHAVVL